MIITSIAAALLAAVTGMTTTVRGPGGTQRQVPVEPTYAWEMSMAEIGKSTTFDRLITHFRKTDIANFGFTREQRKVAHAVSETFQNISFTLRERNFVPVKMSYYNVYSLEKVPGKFHQPERYKQDIEYSVITFIDQAENELNFLDTCGSPLFDAYKAPANVVAYDSGLDEVDEAGTKAILSLFVKVGLVDFTYLKTYELVLEKDDVITDTGLVDMMGSNQSGTMGIYFQNMPPYNDWEIIGIILRSRKNRHDVIKPGLINVPMVADDGVISSPIGGLMMKYALEESDFLAGHDVLAANQVNASMNVAMSMDYNDMLQLNDLVIVQ